MLPRQARRPTPRHPRASPLSRRHRPRAGRSPPPAPSEDLHPRATVRRPRPPRCEAEPGEPPAEPLPPAGSPALDRADRAVQPSCHVFAGIAFQATEHDRDAIALGQAIDLPRGGPTRVRSPGGRRADRARRRSRIRASASGPSPTGRATRCGAPPDGARGPGDPDPERSRDPGRGPGTSPERHPARRRDWPAVPDGLRQDHRPVPIDDRRERQTRRLAAAGGELREQLTVARISDRAEMEDRVEPPERIPVHPRVHRSVPRSALGPGYPGECPEDGRRLQDS